MQRICSTSWQVCSRWMRLTLYWRKMCCKWSHIHQTLSCSWGGKGFEKLTSAPHPFMPNHRVMQIKSCLLSLHSCIQQNVEYVYIQCTSTCHGYKSKACVGFFPGHASLAYFFFLGSLGAWESMLMLTTGGAAATEAITGAKSMSGARFGMRSPSFADILKEPKDAPKPSEPSAPRSEYSGAVYGKLCILCVILSVIIAPPESDLGFCKVNDNQQSPISATNLIAKF